MASINQSNPRQDRSVFLIDNFYKFSLSVDSNLYDTVLSFFKQRIDNDFAAKNFALNLFRISEDNNVPVVTLIEQIKDQNQLQLSQTFAYYLNNLRSNSTLLGVGAPVLPAKYAARNVVQ